MKISWKNIGLMEKKVYLKEGKRVFLEIEIWEGYLLFFDDECRMAGFGTECKNRKE